MAVVEGESGWVNITTNPTLGTYVTVSFLGTMTAHWPQ